MHAHPHTPTPASSPRVHGLTAIAVAVALAGCATVDPGTPSKPAVAAAASVPASAPASSPSAVVTAAAAGAKPAAVGPATPAAPPAPGAPPPFATVTKDATSSAGLLPVWTKDDKTWLEIPADQLGKPLFLGASIASGLGQGFILPGLMSRGQVVVVLRRVGNNVQLVARNMGQRAPGGTALERAVNESYSDSLLASAPLAAAPHPERKSLLVDAMALFGGDIPAMQTQLEMAFRMPYSLDRGNSNIERARSAPQYTAVTVRAHFAVPKLPVPPVLMPGAPPPNPAALPSPPSAVPDARSFFITWVYTLAALPEKPMQPRAADQRVGYFVDAHTDYGDDTGSDRQVYAIRRWRLEKKDPAAEISEPKEAVRVVMDRNIPPKWRDPVRAGILEWNKAFERAGFRNALAVEQQPDDADWTAFEGTRLLAVRWFAMEGPGATAVGPSQSDPRSGEMLRGAAIIPENWVRLGRNRLADTQTPLPTSISTSMSTSMSGLEGAAPGEFAPRLLSCTFASDVLEEREFGMALLEARGELPATGPAADRYIADSLKEVVMHEVGHALGLRHNFKASMGITRAQLADPAFTAQRGTSNSVMDYLALNLPLQGEPMPQYQMTTLGSYDYWAINYGYRELAPDSEKQTLLQLARQGETDPALVYGTDEDSAAADPDANQRDLGDDPLAFALRQLKLSRELWSRTEARQLSPDDDQTLYRRNLQRMFGGLGISTGLLTKHVGGVRTSRALASSQQPLYAPVPAQRQRQALQALLTEVFASTSFKFDPKIISRLGYDQVSRLTAGQFTPQTDFSLPMAVWSLQRPALDALMSDSLAARIADAEPKVAEPKQLLSYAEIQSQLSQQVWSELKAPAARSVSRDIDSLRRTLQREHLRRLASGVLRPSSPAAADVRAVHRVAAQALEADLKRALAQPGWSATARAHLADSQATLAEALKAPLVKQGV